MLSGLEKYLIISIPHSPIEGSVASEVAAGAGLFQFHTVRLKGVSSPKRHIPQNYFNSTQSD